MNLCKDKIEFIHLGEFSVLLVEKSSTWKVNGDKVCPGREVLDEQSLPGQMLKGKTLRFILESSLEKSVERD